MFARGSNGFSGCFLVFGICIVLYLIYCTMYTAMNIPFGSLASVITDDPQGRTVLSTARSVGSGVGTSPAEAIRTSIM